MMTLGIINQWLIVGTVVRPETTLFLEAVGRNHAAGIFVDDELVIGLHLHTHLSLLLLSASDSNTFSSIQWLMTQL